MIFIQYDINNQNHISGEMSPVVLHQWETITITLSSYVQTKLPSDATN